MSYLNPSLPNDSADYSIEFNGSIWSRSCNEQGSPGSFGQTLNLISCVTDATQEPTSFPSKSPSKSPASPPAMSPIAITNNPTTRPSKLPTDAPVISNTLTAENEVVQSTTFGTILATESAGPKGEIFGFQLDDLLIWIIIIGISSIVVCACLIALIAWRQRTKKLKKINLKLTNQVRSISDVSPNSEHHTSVCSTSENAVSPDADVLDDNIVSYVETQRDTQQNAAQPKESMFESMYGNSNNGDNHATTTMGLELDDDDYDIVGVVDLKSVKMKRLETEELYKRESEKETAGGTDQGIISKINAFKVSDDGNNLPPAPEIELMEGISPPVSSDMNGEASVDPEFAQQWKGTKGDDADSLSSDTTNHELFDGVTTKQAVQQTAYL